MIRPKSQKRAREKARVDRQKEKERRRAEARERKANAPPRTGEEDPDLAGIQPGDILLRLDDKEIIPPEHPVFPMGTTSKLKAEEVSLYQKKLLELDRKIRDERPRRAST